MMLRVMPEQNKLIVDIKGNMPQPQRNFRVPRRADWPGRAVQVATYYVCTGIRTPAMFYAIPRYRWANGPIS